MRYNAQYAEGTSLVSSMSHSDQEEGTVHPTLSALANERRRLLLVALERNRTPVSVRDLATRVVASQKDKELAAVATEAVEGMRLSLRHADLPRLARADLVEWDREAGTVAPAGHPALRTPLFDRLVAVEADDWDAVLASLAAQRRRAVLTVLGGRSDPMDETELARWVLARERQAGLSESRSVDDVLATLHHNHLPQLDDAGLVDHDQEDGAVAYEGHSELPTEWVETAPIAAGDDLLGLLRERLDAGAARPATRNEGSIPETPQ